MGKDYADPTMLYSTKGSKRLRELVRKIIATIEARKLDEIGDIEQLKADAREIGANWKAKLAAVRAAKARWGRKTTVSDVVRLAIENLAKSMKL